jgi:hypothetical protein
VSAASGGPTGAYGAFDVIYESEHATVICGDARVVLPTLGTEGIDCVATDPPYGVAWRSNTRKDRFQAIEGDATEGEATDLLATITPDLVRVVRRTRHLYTFGLPLDHPLLPVKADLVWDKGRLGSGDLSQVWAPSHEPVFFHVRAADKTNAERGSGGLAARLRRGSVISVKRLSATQVKRHPTEKPVPLMAQIVESSTVRGELVLDPFAGCGSTGVAAILTGRRVLLVEQDAGYAAIAADRVQEAETIMQKAVAV